MRSPLIPSTKRERMPGGKTALSSGARSAIVILSFGSLHQYFPVPPQWLSGPCWAAMGPVLGGPVGESMVGGSMVRWLSTFVAALVATAGMAGADGASAQKSGGILKILHRD